MVGREILALAIKVRILSPDPCMDRQVVRLRSAKAATRVRIPLHARMLLKSHWKGHLISKQEAVGSSPSRSAIHYVMLPHHDEHTGRAILPKEVLVDGTYYVGRCRNATIARWSAANDCFYHWRIKFDQVFIEEIKHPVDETYYDVFRPVRELEEPKFDIPLDVHARFEGDAEDLTKYDTEMWSRVCDPVFDPVA